MYSLTINFKTKEELQAYLASGGEAKTRRTKKTAKKEEKTVAEQVPEDTTPKRPEPTDDQLARDNAMEELSLYVNNKVENENMTSADLTQLSNDTKRAMKIDITSSMSAQPASVITDFTVRYKKVVEAFQKKRREEASGSQSIF